MKNQLHYPRQNNLFNNNQGAVIFRKAIGILFLSLFVFLKQGMGQIVAWEFNGAAGNETTIAATTLDGNLNATSINRGSGILSSSLANSFSSTDFTASGTFAQAVTNNDYLQFTINAKPGYKVSLSTLDANFRRSGTGPNTFQWQWSTNAFSTSGTNIGSAITYTLTTSNGDAQAQINLSGITQLQDVSNSTTVTIRLYGYGASATGGTFALGRLAGNDLAIGGTVTQITSTFSQLTNGIAASPLTAGITNQAILGVAGTSNGAANLTAFNIATSTTTVGKFINLKLYRSTDNSYSTAGDNTQVIATINQTATQIQVSAISEALSASAKNYFVVADVSGSVAGSTPAVTPSLTNTDVTVSDGIINAFTVTGSAYSFLSAASPVLTYGNSALLAAFGNVCINTTAGPNSFSLDGANLDGSDVTIGPFTGYTFSASPGGIYAGTLTISGYSGGTFSTTVFVKFTPTLVQSYSGNISISGGSTSTTAPASGAGIDTPPTVTSGSATGITSTGATLAGAITTGGCSATLSYGVEISTTNGFTNGTGAPNSGSNLSLGAFSVTLSGLLPNIVYYYHAYAANNGGISYGTQQSFTTSQLDAPVATAATALGTTGFTANWSPAVTGATSYRLDVSTVSTFTTGSISNVAGWSFTSFSLSSDVGNANNTGANAKTLSTVGGTSSITSVGSGATLAATATGWDGGSGSKYWQVADVNTNDMYNLTLSSDQQSSGTGPKDFKVQYKIGAGGTWTDVPGGSITILSSSTLTPLSNLALPGACENKSSVYLRWIMTSNLRFDQSIPNNTVASTGTSRISHIFIKGNAGSYVTGYQDLIGAGTSSVVTGLSPNTTYYYRARAFATSSTSANSNVIQVTTTCPVINPSISGTLIFCSGSSTVLDAGAGYSGYSWSNGATTQTITVNSGGTFSVFVTDAYGCNGTSSSVTTTVNSFSIAPSGISGTTTTCSGNPITLTVMGGTLGTGANYQWGTGAVVGTSPLTGETASTLNVSPTGNTTYWVRIENTAAPCTGTTSGITQLVTVNQPSSAPTGISGTTTICNGGSTILTATGGILGTGANYQWGAGATPGVNPLSGETSSTLNVSPTGNATYWVRIENTTVPCTGTTSGITQLVTVNTLSTAPTSVTSNDADNEICSGNSVLLTANGGVLGSSPGASYKWYEGGCGTGSALGSASTLNVINPSTGSHTYYVHIEDACGNTTCSSITILVTSALPGIVTGGFTTPASACSTNVALITVTPVGGQNIYYSWNTGSNSSVALFSTNIGGPFSAGPFSTATNQVFAQFGAIGPGQSGYDVCVQGVNGCGSTANRCIWIRGVVNGPGPITPPDGVVACQNTSQLYSCGLSNGATIYTWTLNGSTAAITPNGGNNPTNVTVSFPTGFTTAQLCVTAALSCGGTSTSPARCITINKNPANPLIPAGAATVCPGATGVSYSVPAVPGASGYSWTVPANATIAAGLNSPSITVNFPTPYTGSSSVCVTATSSCGASAVKCKTVVSGIPSQPAGITGPLNNICGSIVQYSVVSPPGGLTYTWTNPAGTTLTGQGGSTIQLTVSPTFTSGSLTVVANSALCAPATSAARTSSTFWGRPNNPGTITQNPGGTFCLGASLTFSVVNPPIGPAPYYTWTTSNGAFTSPQGANNIDVLWSTSTASGTITVKASNSCGLSAGTSSQSFSSGCREEGINTSSANAFSVYPNPAHDKITVSIDVNKTADFTIQMTDVSGRVVLLDTSAALAGLNAYDMDLTHLSKGVYMLEVKSAQNNWNTKVVVE